MRILITNDDGYLAPGIALLKEIAERISADVWVVAPEQEQSGSGHSLSLRTPLRMRQIAEKYYAVSGTPTDSVLVAVKALLTDRKPDLLLSGINRGHNLGEDVTYSGTVAGAMEGSLLGITSIALSQGGKEGAIDWSAATIHGEKIIRNLLDVGWPAHSLVNVNFPECSAADVCGVRVCPQGRRKIGALLKQNKDPDDKPYYWIGSRRDEEGDIAHSDLSVVRDNFIAITPLSLDLTDYSCITKFDAELTSYNLG